MTSLLYLLAGFPLLIKGADWLVGGASALAKRFGVPQLVIGLTIVAFGTSAPELVVSITSALQGNTEIALGNVVGSNIANILFILGICAIIRPLTVQKGTTWKEIPFSLLAMLMAGVLVADGLIDGASFSAIMRADGLVLLGLFAVFFYYTFGLTKSVPEKEANKAAQKKRGKEPKEKQMSGLVMGLSIIGGLVGLVIGGKLVVDGAVSLATALGVSSTLIGLTIVAVGTSLPELATSAVAAYRGNSDIAIGNVVGSNIFNIFWILGVTALIRPLPLPPGGLVDVAVGIAATIVLFVSMFLGKRHTLDRWQGVIFVALYIGYVLYLIFRG
jgi:cation:H+ antiporter